LTQTLQKLDDKNHEIQALNTEMAIAQQKLANSLEELTNTKNQYELRLNHITEEKYAAVATTDVLRKELTQLQQQLSNQAEKHQAIMVEKCTRQEQSEKRWLNLIDRSRVDAKSAQKNYENTINKQNKQIELMQTNIVDYKHKIITQQSELENCKATIADLKAQLIKNNKKHASITRNLRVKKQIQ